MARSCTQSPRPVGTAAEAAATGDPLITAEVVASAIAPRFDPASSTLTEIRQSTHWPHAERPAAVAREIDRFLAANLATQATDGRAGRSGR